MTDEPIVDIALGKSLFYNEYKGNFNTAAGAAETALHVLRIDTL